MIKNKETATRNGSSGASGATLITLVVLLVGVFFAGVVSAADTEILIKDKSYIEDIRTTNTLIADGHLTKEYIADEKRLVITGEKKWWDILEVWTDDSFLDLRLVGDYTKSGLIAGPDTLVAEFFIGNHTGDVLFEDISLFNVKEDYSDEADREFTYRYGVDVEECWMGDCYNKTNWNNFNSLSEVPNNVKIGMFTETKPNEHIEFVPTINGFEIMEWAAWDVSNIVFIQSLSVAVPDVDNEGLFFKPDGTKMYTVGYNLSEDVVYEYDLSTAWNISTATQTINFSTAAQTSLARGLFFKPDGTKMYVSEFGGSDSVYAYNLSSAWDISTASYSSESYSLEDSFPKSLFFKPDGTKMYNSDSFSDIVYEYDLSSAWDVSTASSIQNFSGNGHGIWMKNDGVKAYFSDGFNINEYDAGTPWDISTLVLNQTKNPSGIGIIDDIYIEEDGIDMYLLGSETIYQYTMYIAPSVSITYPLNGTNYGSVNHFNWSVSDATKSIDTCQYSLDGATNVSVTCSTKYKSISTGDGSHDILFTFNDTEGVSNWTQNYFTVDTTAPVINVTYPFGSITNQTVGNPIYFNWTATDVTSSLSSCWYNYNNTNTTVTCGDQNTTFITNIAGQRNITFYANDSASNVANFTRYWDYKFLEYNKIFNATSYETITDSYILNMSSDGTETVTASLWYNNTEYIATKVGNNQEMTFTSERSHPFGEIGNQSFYWTVAHGATLINTSTSYQDVKGIYMGQCNATLTTPFINLTFKDEASDAFINSTIEVYDWFYFVGDGSQNKTFDLVNATEQESYSVCATPNLTFFNNASIKYAADGYPQRIYAQSADLTNETTFLSLYLLGTADGQYVTFQLQDSGSSRLEGVTLIIERQSGGVWTTIGQDITDSAGLVTFFLNPDDNHRITATKESYSTYVSTIRPTQSIYTIIMEGGEEYLTYGTFEGINYLTYPQTGLVLSPNTTYDFGFNITTSRGNVTECKMIITNTSFHEVGSVTGCNADGGNISLSLNTADNERYFGNYYVNLGEGYQLIETGNSWTIAFPGIPEDGAYAVYLMNKFGNYTGFGGGTEADYNRITFFFIVLVIGAGFLTRYSGIEVSSPGYTLAMLTGIIIIFSYVGIFTISGIVANAWIAKYYVAMTVTLITLGFLINYWRVRAAGFN